LRSRKTIRSTAKAEHPAGLGGDEELLERRHHRTGGGAEQVRGGRDVAPAQDGQVLLRGELLDPGDRLRRVVRVGRQEGDTGGVAALHRQLEVAHLAVVGVRDLDQDAGPVAGVRFGAGSAAVLEVAQGGQGLRHDVVAGFTGQGRDERDTTSVVLVLSVVETLAREWGATKHSGAPVVLRSITGRGTTLAQAGSPETTS
jgi:hypothetical protein